MGRRACEQPGSLDLAVALALGFVKLDPDPDACDGSTGIRETVGMQRSCVSKSDPTARPPPPTTPAVMPRMRSRETAQKPGRGEVIPGTQSFQSRESL